MSTEGRIMSAHADRCAREDEEDRLVAVNARYEIEGTAKALPGPERLGLAVALLLSLTDEGILTGWNVKYPERGDA